MRRFAIPVLVFFLLIGLSFAKEDVLELEIEISVNDTAKLNYYKIIQGSSYPPRETGNYRLVVEDKEGNEVYSNKVNVNFFLFDAPGVFNETTHYDKIPYSPEMSRLKLYHGDKMILDEPLLFCDQDGNCDENENYLSCPADCSLDEKDGYCYPEDDGICDPDCIKGRDPDCKAVVEPECGDGKCNAGESYSSCPADCKKPKEEPQEFPWIYLAVLIILLVVLVLLVLRKRSKPSEGVYNWDEVYQSR